MSKKFAIFRTQKVTKETPFDETFAATLRIHGVFMLSMLSYLVLAWALQQTVWTDGQMGFINLPETTYLALLVAAGVITVLLIAVLLLYLPKVTSPAAVLAKKSPQTLEAFGFELNQAQILRITVAQVPAILGLVLFLLNGNLLHLVVFVIVSLVLLLYIFPRKGDWEEAKKLFENQQAMQG